MKTDPKAKGKPDSGDLAVDHQLHRSTAKARDGVAEEKPGKPTDIQFASIIEKINEGFVALDAQMNFTYINQRGSELFQRKPEELIGKNYWEEYPQDKDTSFGEAYLRALETQTPIELEDYYAPRERWFENRIYPTEDGLSIFFNDITERKQVETALRQSEERFTRFMQHLPALAWIKDGEGRYVFANYAAEEAFNTPRDQLYGRRDEDIFPPETATQFKQNDEHALASRKGVQVIETLEQADGILHYSLVNKFPIPGPDGNITLIGGTAFDITEHKQAEEALRERSEQVQQVLAELQATYDQSPVGMLQLDTNLRYVRVNKTMAAMNGLPPAEHIGKTIHEVVPDLADQIYDAFVAVLETGQPVLNKEVEGETAAEPGVRHIWLESWFPLRDADDQIIGLNVVAQDITERKQMEGAILRMNEVLEERVIERTAALVRSEREVRRVASLLTMAEQEERRRISQLLHDELQQMLYAIQINLTFVRQDAEAGNILAALEQMTEVEQWLRQGIEITRQLTVDLSPPILKSEGLTEALNWLITQMKQIHKLEVLLTAEHAFRMPDEDMRVLLFQIIRELLFNIVKHAGTDRVAVDLRSQNDQLVIRVTDEGHGFNVAEAEARAEREGRFGLFSVRERVGLFGGRMEIDSAPGAGTRILIYIPTVH